MRDVAFLILRLGLAIVMFPHGAQKALGWFGGPGIPATVGAFTTTMHIPVVVAYLVIAAEFVGPILLVLGILTRLAALAIGVDMFFAAVLVHAPNGFFLNFTGHQAGEGVEFSIALVTIALALVVGGAGRFALLPRT
jgi:putative oxidoreductase